MKWLCNFVGSLLQRLCPRHWEATDAALSELAFGALNDQEIFAKDASPERALAAYEQWKLEPGDSFRDFLRLAEEGSVWSMLFVAAAYQTGRGVAASPDEAALWYRRAYEGGADRALLHFARILQERNDLKGAKEVLRSGAARDLTPAMRALAHMELRQKSKSARSFGRSLLERAGDAGDVVARLELACAMSRGRFGYREALHGFRTFFRLADEFVFPLVDQKLAAQPAKARSSLWSKLGLRRRKPSR